MKYQTFLPPFPVHARRKCCANYDGGILIKDNVPHCRWCRSSFQAASTIRLEDDHFNSQENYTYANELFSLSGNRTDFENYLVTQTVARHFKSERDDYATLADELEYKVKELKGSIKKLQEDVNEAKPSSSTTESLLQRYLTENRLSDEEKSELRQQAYISGLIQNINSLEKKIKAIDNNETAKSRNLRSQFVI